MVGIVVAGGVLRRLAGLLAAGVLPWVAAAAAPLTCDRPVVALGVVQAATGIVTHVFDLVNEGDVPLLLDEAASPCSCLSLQLATNRLAVGAHTRLPMVLDLRRRNGEQRLAAHIGYRVAGQPERRYLKLTVQAMVVGTNTAVEGEAPPAVFVEEDETVVQEAEGEIPSAGASAGALSATVVVELFGEPGCEACATVRREVLPEARALLGACGRIIERDVFETTNYMVLAAYQERFGVQPGRRNDPVSVVVDGLHYLGGVEEIRRELPTILRKRLAARAADSGPAVPLAMPDPGIAARRLAGFRVAGVALAGLLDGVNPCAFATVVFLASLLTLARVRGAGVLLMGCGFLCGTFLTYYLLGLGLFHGLQALQSWRWVGRALDLIMGVLLAVLALYSFRDAWRFAHSGRAADVTLRMPDKLRQRVHGLLRRRITPGGLFGSGFVASVLVTLLESVCTGQVYGPTLMAVARDPNLRAHGLGLLAVYNLAFLVPVLLVMIAAWRGTTSLTLAEWSRRNAVWGKVLLGLFFLALGIVLLVT
jgi:hypothetical protein